ncbi:MAG: BACON domain-containing protein [Bacteroidales bacterium]|nr:BACON domain-containing protein [Bacteroidales bacterium]
MRKLFVLLFLILPVCSLLAQNPDFQRRYEQAEQLYNQGQFEKARTAIQNSLRNLPSLSADQIQMGRVLESRCTQAISKRDQLDMATNNLEVGYQRGLDSLAFTAARPSTVKAVSSDPSWFKVERVTDKFIVYSTEFNPDKAPRKTQLTVTMGKIRRTVQVEQVARPETQKKVIVRTEPDHATVTVEGKSPVSGLWEDTLPSGVYKIHAEKNGYYQKDTVITVVDDMQIGQIQDVVLKLAPQFAKLKVEILPEEGFHFGQEPVILTLNGVAVSAPRDEYNYDDDRDIQRYCYYSDGTIPVSPGWVDVLVTCRNFESVKTQVQARAGEEIPITYTLRPFSGYLTLLDEGQALDAVVKMDGETVGTVRDLVRKPVLVGDHLITLEKEGFVSRETTYPVTVKEQEEVSIGVSMVRFRPYVFTSDPSDATVTVDGDVIGYTPTEPYFLRDLGPEHVYKLVVEKGEYLAVQRDIVPDFSAQDVVTEHAKLQTAHKFGFSADEADLLLTVKDRRGGDSLYVNKVPLPAEIGLPWRDKPYYFEVSRIGERHLAYRGNFRFNEGSKDNLFIRSWSKSDFSIISANYFLAGAPEVNLGLNNKPYRNIANANLIKFRVFSGLSTSVIRATLFQGRDGDTPLEIPQGSGDTSRSIFLDNANYLPGFTCLFLNGEFRVGGSVLSVLDANAIVSYAWYPDFWKKIIPISYMSGHDVFIGAEVSTRFPIMNVNLKAGMQMYPNLQANIYSSDYKAASGEQANFFVQDVPVPSMFVVTIGFSLGSKDSKGNNILRVF